MVADHTQQLRIACNAAAVPRARAFIASLIEDAGVGEDTAFDLLLAFDEAAANACRHGHPDDRRGYITVRWSYSPGRVAIVVADNGHGFDPAAVDVSRPPDPLASGGRGLYLMHQLMDDVVIDSSDVGTLVTMQKDLPAFETSAIRRSA